eukprot:s11413_g2.t1
MGSMRHLGHLSSWQNLFRDSRIDGEYYCSWHSDFVLNGTEGLRQTDSTARAVWKPTLSCLVHWAGGTHANGAQNKQLNQATCEVRLLDVASESAMLVGLLVILAVRLPPAAVAGSSNMGSYYRCGHHGGAHLHGRRVREANGHRRASHL